MNKDVIEGPLELKAVAIEHIHRIGRAEPNKIRPVIFKLLDSRDKYTILKRGYKLKDTQLSIAEDFSKHVRDIRRKLWNSAKVSRQKNEKVSIVFSKLYINNRPYVWSNEQDDKVPLEKNYSERGSVNRRAGKAANTNGKDKSGVVTCRGTKSVN